MARGHRRRFAPGVRLVLALIAMLPLVGLGWFSVRSLDVAADRAATAAELEDGAPELAQLSLLDSHISAESYWGNAIATAGSLGVPAELISQVVGFDVERFYAESQEQVDELALEMGLEDIAQRLVEARRVAAEPGATSAQIDLAYLDVKHVLDAIIDDRITAMSSLANEVPGSEATARAVDVLDLAVQLNERGSRLATSYFAARYPTEQPGENPVRDFLGAISLYEDLTRRLEDALEPASAAFAAWEATRSDPLVVALLDRVAAAMDVASSEAPESGSIDFSAIDIDAEARAFIDSLAAVDLYVQYVDTAAVELTETAAALRAAQVRAQGTVIVTTVLIGVLSLIAVFVASRWIIRPLRRVAQVVDAIREGELSEAVPLTGPREVQAAAEGINEAADHLKLAEQQAAVLADEDLDHPILRTTAPGKLGASLQTAVRRLAVTLGEREEFRQRLQHEATHDGLTGLANRSAAMVGLSKALARVRRTDADLAVLFVDVDAFKQVNDVYGHEAGDRLLRTIARRVLATVREGDLVARLGGDEFLVIAEPVKDVDEAVELATRLLERIGEPLAVGGSEILPSVSIGVSLAGSSDLSPDEILRDADLAVYRAKEHGRSRVEVCDVHLRNEIARQVDIESALREAIEQDELVIHYQPVVDAADHAPLSLEALVRWERPGHGLISPNVFVPVAERSELIVAMDRWVLDRVAAQVGRWATHPVLCSLPVAVNLSPRHIASPRLTADVLEALRVHDVDPSRLILEITETALLNDLETAAVQFNELRRHGIRVALDDFGTGYTSLALLRRLPVDVLKIDQSFAGNLNNGEDRSLVRLIVETGHLLRVEVTAEGVESSEQAERLAALGSDHLQGYWFSRPLEPEPLERLMASRATLASGTTG